MPPHLALGMQCRESKQKSGHSCARCFFKTLPIDRERPGADSRLVELLFFGRTRQSGHAGTAALDNGRDLVKVTSTHLLLM